MRNYTFWLVFVVALLFLFFSYSSWTNAFVVQHGEAMNPSYEIFSVASPLLIGLLIMGAVVLMVVASVEGRAVRRGRGS